MTCLHHPFRHPHVMLAMAMLAVGAMSPTPLCAADAKPAKPTIALLVGGADDDLKVIRETLGKVPGVKFKADEVKFADFGRDGGKFTSFLPIEIADLAQADIGTIAKAVAEAKTSKKGEAGPALWVIIKYRPGTTKNEPFREALAKVKGLQADKSWVGDANLWISVDGSGQCKLTEIIRALNQTDVKFRDPITGTSE